MATPTLLIVGSRDEPFIKMNREALALLKTEKELVIVPGATLLFEEPGRLDQVSMLARDWFLKYLCRPDLRRAAIIALTI